MKKELNDGILLESGTNEIEVLEIILGTRYVGINVLKIKEIVKFEDSMIDPMPGEKNAGVGSFIFKDQCVPVVDLGLYFNQKSERNRNNVLVLCEFNNNFVGFVVTQIGRIRRLTWRDVKPLPPLMSDSKVMAIGVAVIDGRQLYMLDLEKVIEDLFPPREVSRTQSSFQDSMMKLREARRNIKILIVDDSGLIRNKVSFILGAENYTNTRTYENGDQVYQEILSFHKQAIEQTVDINRFLDLVITDIEMPQLDGLTLCRRLKELSKEIKVFVLSSMITEQIVRKCNSVGADGALSKGELNELVGKIDKLCLPEFLV